MCVPLPPLEAYRRDVARRPRQEPFGDADGSWVVLATALWQQGERVRRETVRGIPQVISAPVSITAPAAAAVVSSTTVDVVGGPTIPATCNLAPPAPAPASRAPAASLDGLLIRVLDRAWVHRDAERTAAGVLGVAAQIEEAEALLLAQAVLAALAEVAESHTTPLTFGRTLAQRARVERKLGHYDVAEDLYSDAGRLGARMALAELQARSDLGRGVLARIRGNYPEARRLFRRTLRRAERAGLRELTGAAHEGLMIAATAASDFDLALQHGWAALANAAGNATKEADVLHNLADVCRQVGDLDAALQGFLGAAERGAARIRVAALANAAHVAALLGRRELFAECARQCDAELPTDSVPYDRAQRLLTLALACDAAGEGERASGYRHRGLELAWSHRFTELLLHHEATNRPGAPREVQTLQARRRTLESSGRRVARALSALRADAPVLA